MKEELAMSKKQRKIKKAKKYNSPEQKAKREKKAYYASFEAAAKWEEKKERKHQSQINQRESKGVSTYCPLLFWEEPSPRRCAGCKLKCSFNK